MPRFDVTFTRTETAEEFRQIIDSTSQAKLIDGLKKQGSIVSRCVELPDPFAGILPKPRQPIIRYLVTAVGSDGVEVEFTVSAADECDMKSSVDSGLKVIRYRVL